MLTQQHLLLNAMQKLSWSKKQLAAFLKVDQMKLASFLLENNEGFKTLDLHFQDDLFQKMRAKELKDSDVPEGTTSKEVPVIYCDMFNFDFPTLYRVTYEFEGFDLTTGGRDVGQNFIEHSYALTNKPVHGAKNATAINVEPVRARSRTKSSDTDKGWIYISEHRSIERADAYLDACINFLFAPNKLLELDMYQFEGRIFTLVHTEPPSGDGVKERLTIYKSDKYLDLRTPVIAGLQIEFFDENEWELAIDAEGCRTERYDNWN